MRLKIRCDGECEKFCKIFWELNKALDPTKNQKVFKISRHIESCGTCMKH